MPLFFHLHTLRFCQIILFVYVIGVFMAGWRGELNFFNDEPSVWFQRTGAFVIFTAIPIEILLLRYHEWIRGKVSYMSENKLYSSSSHHAVMAMAAKGYLPFEYLMMKALNVFIAIFATAIWGYGDLIYLAFK